VPWKACQKRDETLRFVATCLDGEKIAPLCREFGISRFTGHDIIERLRDCGTEAFTLFHQLFQEYGVPKRIRSDNGVPFASAHALHGLSKLSV
jgi:hypothetical protein